jgi:hypothetical protein
VLLRGYCERNFRCECASGLYLLGTDREECCDEIPLDADLELEEGSELRSTIGGLGDRDGRLFLDMVEGLRDAGKEESEVRRLAAAG